MIENIIIIDTETTGLNAAKGSVMIEVAAVLYNLKRKCILQQFTSLLPCHENPVIHINNIDPIDTQLRYSKPIINLVIESMAMKAQAFVAHNAQFDKSFMETLDLFPHSANLKWICTVKDFQWGVQLARRKLQDVCEAMNVPYVNAHRALNDVNFMIECFSKIEDLSERMNAAAQLSNSR